MGNQRQALFALRPIPGIRTKINNTTAKPKNHMQVRRHAWIGTVSTNVAKKVPITAKTDCLITKE
jgi:hypothetical protein